MKKASALPIGLAGLISPVPAIPPPKSKWCTHLRPVADERGKGAQESSDEGGVFSGVVTASSAGTHSSLGTLLKTLRWYVNSPAMTAQTDSNRTI